MDLTVIVPTFNEAPNVAELVRRVEKAVEGIDAEILFVDDSNDNTPDVVREVASRHVLPVRLLHRDNPVGGLSGAVIEGLRSTTSRWSIVMDGDLQHRPETLPAILAKGDATGADVVVASRHVDGGSSDGLSGGVRRLVSQTSIKVTKALFPSRLHGTSDPMSGFFGLRRGSIEVDGLHARGFKILLEILARQSLSVAEVPLVFEARLAGTSKADMKQGIALGRQLFDLKFGRISGFAAIGALGAVANLAILYGLQQFGVGYLAAACIAAVATIIGNFLLQERFIFNDLKAGARTVWKRWWHTFAFNGTESAVRTFLLWLIVETTSLHSVLVQAGLIAIGFTLRYLYQSRIVYKNVGTSEPTLDDIVESETAAHEAATHDISAHDAHPATGPVRQAEVA
ncbi:dolichol-phosphate mannosyltransferase [Frondihabitans sp. PhB188]|uniref:glycosyltransferase n=1 Tax=Frondihabitans sp. PhB188 TaxID=2485200 RepID=UPI000F47F433|nr:glycosyltransferase [Frondihabitans sp. PhB188]ROQ40896.1 dolichol-phosphate mannosyltransferase [Frondihabitans sp. PhB188]